MLPSIHPYRVKLPRVLFDKLALQALVEKKEVNALILRAVAADLRSPRAKSRRRRSAVR